MDLGEKERKKKKTMERGKDVKDSVLSGFVLLMRRKDLKGWISKQDE